MCGIIQYWTMTAGTLLLPGFAYSQNVNLNWVMGFKQRCKIHEEMGQRGLTN